MKKPSNKSLGVILIIVVVAIGLFLIISPRTVDDRNLEKETSGSIEVDEGYFPNIISVEGNIFVIYIKRGDIYTKKFYSDLRPLGQPVKLTNNGNINDLQAQFSGDYYVHMTYSDDSKNYKAIYSIDWGETSKEETSEKLSRSTSVAGYSVSSKDGFVYIN